jgi:hypothetical protein
MKLLSKLLIFAPVACITASNAFHFPEKTCVVKPSGSSSVDDAPAIVQAFKECGHNGKVVFLNETYHINTVMNTTGLKNCEVDLRGTLLVASPTSCARRILTLWVVGNKYLILAEQLASNWISESIFCLVFWRGKHQFPRARAWYSRRQRANLVHLHPWQEQLPWATPRYYHLEYQKFGIRGNKICPKSNVVRLRSKSP